MNKILQSLQLTNNTVFCKLCLDVIKSFLFFSVVQIRRAKRSALDPGQGPGQEGGGQDHVQDTGN